MCASERLYVYFYAHAFVCLCVFVEFSLLCVWIVMAIHMCVVFHNCVLKIGALSFFTFSLKIVSCGIS